MKKIFYVLLIIPLLFTTCKKKEEYKPPTKYYLSDEDLKWIKYQKDTLSYKITTLNKIDTIKVPVKWHVYFSAEWNYQYGIGGIGIYYNNLNVINNIEIGRVTNDLKAEVGGFDINYKSLKSYFNNPNYPLDTAKINNIIYQNVYKFRFNKSESSDIKTFYFAKGYGPLKIETQNGDKIELIN